MKLLILLFIITNFLFATTGEDIFQNQCISCHLKSIDFADKTNIKAPPMNMIVMRLKGALYTKKEFVVFVKDYIQNPSQDKGYCMKAAYAKFGTMPEMGTKLTIKEKELIAIWLYEEFSGTQIKDTNIKCGAGKCGNNMRCGADKRGSR